MKNVYLLSLLLFFSIPAFAGCVLMEDTSLRPELWGSDVKAGSVAVGPNGVEIGMRELLKDPMIHFKDADGNISDGYSWLYAKPRKVSKNVYRAFSYGETVTITFASQNEASTLVTYVGSKSGKFLSLSCN
jgi:hypothetical protein